MLSILLMKGHTMSEKDATKETKKSPLLTFKHSLIGQSNATSILTEGIKNTNAKVRSLAIKIAFRSQDAAFIKKNITPLIQSEKTKRVLRTIASKMTRKTLSKKLADLKAAAPKAKKEETTTEAPKA